MKDQFLPSLVRTCYYKLPSYCLSSVERLEHTVGKKSASASAGAQAHAQTPAVLLVLRVPQASVHSSLAEF